jgi:hypothetical protein
VHFRFVPESDRRLPTCKSVVQCQIATICTAVNGRLFDHLVGAGEQYGRDRKTERLSSL